MKKVRWMYALIVLGLVACGVGNPVSNKLIGARMDDSGVTPTDIAAVVQANNRFAVDVYGALKEEGENVFLSPYSIAAAMAMAYEGARGQTAQEIEDVFYLPDDERARRAAFAALYNQLNEADAEHELRVANALWAQKDYGFLETYVNTLQSYYAADAVNVDFVGATEDARKTINGWVEDITNDKIKDLFPRGSLNASTRLVLTNAIYFKGEWVTKFDKSKTKDESFYLDPNTPVNVPMMQVTDNDFRYARDEHVEVLEMPYKGEDVSMIVFLPRPGHLASFESSFSLEELEGWKDRLHTREVDVYLPRFTFETKYFMNETLKEMGMPTAFSNGADFSGMDGTQNLAIQTVIHQAFVSVDEDGTEAAAATGIGVGLTSATPVFRADRPFLFVIQDVAHGNILFLGKVADPRS